MIMQQPIQDSLAATGSNLSLPIIHLPLHVSCSHRASMCILTALEITLNHFITFQTNTYSDYKVNSLKWTF